MTNFIFGSDNTIARSSNNSRKIIIFFPHFHKVQLLLISKHLMSLLSKQPKHESLGDMLDIGDTSLNLSIQVLYSNHLTNGLNCSVGNNPMSWRLLLDKYFCSSK